MKRKIIVIASVFFITFGLNTAQAKSGYEFYFFGININHLKDSKPILLVAGALASVVAHEAGHLLYLESQGQPWSLESSPYSGLAVHSPGHFNNTQLQQFGRSGFMLQTAIGTLLTCFRGSRNSDFTKGWVAMNAFQISTYDVRNHDIGNDFDLVERGGGNTDNDKVLFSVWSHFNLRVLKASDLGYGSSPHPQAFPLSETSIPSEMPAGPWEAEFIPGSLDHIRIKAP